MAAEYARLQVRISSETEAWEDVSLETDGYRVPVAFNTAKDGSGDWLVPLLDSDAHLQVDVLSGGGGGTEYTEGDTDATITGGVLMWEDATNTIRAVSAAKPLPVEITDNSNTVAADVGAIKTAVEILDNAIAGNEMQVDLVGSVPAGTNVVGIVRLQDAGGDEISVAAFPSADNAAVQNTIAASAFPLMFDGTAWDRVRGDSTNGLLVNLGSNNDVTVTGDALTALQLIDDPVATISATPLQRVAIFDDNDAQITSFGGGTQYTEDAAAAANPTGTMPVLVRADTPAGVTTTDGDVVAQRATDYGAAYVQVVDSSGNFVDSFGGSGGTAAADDADFTAGTTQGTPVQGVYESSPTSVTDGDMGVLGITQTRALRVSLDNDDVGLLTSTNFAAAFGTAGSADSQVMSVQGIASMTPILVDATGQGDVPITLDGEAVDTELPAAAALADTAANPTAPAVGAFLMGYDTTQWTRLRTTIGDGAAATGILNVVPMVYNGTTYDRFRGSTDGIDIGDISAGTQTNDVKVTLDSETVTVTASNLDVQSGGADLATSSQGSAIQTAVQLIDDAIYVDDADWTADSSKHALVGGVTQATPTANTDGDVTPLITNGLRELRTAYPESDLATAATTHVKKYYTNAGAVTDGIIWSPAAGKRWYLTLLTIQVSAAATVTIEDDLAAGDSAVYKAEFAANSGVVLPFPTPMFSGEDAADLLITTSAANVYVTAVGYEI